MTGVQTCALPISTPAVAYLSRYLKMDAGVVISASHNPAQDNGIKFFSGLGEKLSDDDELIIENYLFGEDLDNLCPPAEQIGTIRFEENAAQIYSEFAHGSLGEEVSFKGIKAVVDCANGAASYLAPPVLRNFGLEGVFVACQPDGNNINFHCGSMHLEGLQEKVLSEGADLGLAFDGDADRVLLVDEKGENVDGDQMMVICAKYWKEKHWLTNNLVIPTVMSNLGMFKAFERLGIQCQLSPVGDRYVKEKMQEKGSVIGGEQSGHIIFMTINNTGDGIITALQVLRVMVHSGLPLSKLAAEMKKYPQVLLNAEVAEKRDLEMMPATKRAIAEVENILGENGRIVIRYSGTQNLLRVMIEGEEQNQINQLAEKIIGTAVAELSD